MSSSIVVLASLIEAMKQVQHTGMLSHVFVNNSADSFVAVLAAAEASMAGLIVDGAAGNSIEEMLDYDDDIDDDDLGEFGNLDEAERCDIAVEYLKSMHVGDPDVDVLDASVDAVDDGYWVTVREFVYAETIADWYNNKDAVNQALNAFATAVRDDVLDGLPGAVVVDGFDDSLDDDFDDFDDFEGDDDPEADDVDRYTPGQN